jgi:hypothetical protein
VLFKQFRLPEDINKPLHVNAVVEAKAKFEILLP